MKSILSLPVPFPLSFQKSTQRPDTGICSVLQTHLSVSTSRMLASSTRCLQRGGSQKPTEMQHTLCSFLRLFGTDGRQATLSSVCDFTEKEWYESQLQPDFQDFLGCYPCSAQAEQAEQRFRVGGTGAEQAELLFLVCCSAPALWLLYEVHVFSLLFSLFSLLFRACSACCSAPVPRLFSL